MKSSQLVRLTLLSALALTVTGCADKQQVQRCVDQNNAVIDEQECEKANQLKAQYQFNPPSPIPYWWYYHWIFGGNGGYVRGSIIYGGSIRPSVGYVSVRGSAIQSNGGVMPSSRFGGMSRGGFGSTGSGGHGAGE